MVSYGLLKIDDLHVTAIMLDTQGLSKVAPGARFEAGAS